MSRSVLELALRVQTGQRDVGVDCPVLVWEGSPAGEAEQAPFATQALRFSGGRPQPGEAVFFEVRKRAEARNAFAMGVTVGRTETNDIPLEDASVSRFHAWLKEDARSRQWHLVDADSMNGTWVGALKLGASKPEPLADGTRVRVGAVELTFLLPASFVTYLSRYRQG